MNPYFPPYAETFFQLINLSYRVLGYVLVTFYIVLKLQRIIKLFLFSGANDI